jgi:hypothetical protein
METKRGGRIAKIGLCRGPLHLVTGVRRMQARIALLETNRNVALPLVKGVSHY